MHELLKSHAAAQAECNPRIAGVLLAAAHEIEQLKDANDALAATLALADGEMTEYSQTAVTTPSVSYADLEAEIERLQKALAEDLPCELCENPVAEQRGSPVCWPCHCKEVERRDEARRAARLLYGSLIVHLDIDGLPPELETWPWLEESE